MLAFDLGSTKWTLGFTTAPAQRPRMRTMPAGDLGTLVKEMQLAKARFGLPLDASVRSCYEAGRDGFWLHRWLLAHAVDNVVVDSASIEVNRRARRAKTDRREQQDRFNQWSRRDRATVWSGACAIDRIIGRRRVDATDDSLRP
jgi:transposase